MGMYEWAKQQVAIAKQIEKEESEKNGDSSFLGYSEACYNSALRAFESLCKDGHSCDSIRITKQILNRLIDGKPLKAIHDIPEVWNVPDLDISPDKTTYQCKLYSALFKKVDNNGNISYSEVRRARGRDADNGVEYTSGLLTRIIDEMYPITMPYYPTSRPYIFITRDFLYDPKAGDFDTVGVYEMIKPDGDKVEINRWFAEKDGKFVEISKDEYLDRFANKVVR